MPSIKPSDIIVRTSSQGHLRASIGEIILKRARLVLAAIPKTYRGKRVGMALVTGNRPLHPMVNARLLATAYDVFVHQNGTTSIPFQDASKLVGHRRALQTASD
jgi:hypothetical protein